jgi:hypothetical protein
VIRVFKYRSFELGKIMTMVLLRYVSWFVYCSVVVMVALLDMLVKMFSFFVRWWVILLVFLFLIVVMVSIRFKFRLVGTKLVSMF